jgi:beta-xylosidase/AraC-like DNA-binding protein
LAVHSRKTETNTGRAWIYHLKKPLAYPALSLEITFVFDGELEVWDGQRTCRLKEPDVLVLNPPLSSLQRAIARPIKINPLGDCFFLLLKIEPSFLLSAFEGAVPVFDCDSTVQNKDFTVLRSILAEIASVDAGEGGTGLMFHSRLYRILEELQTHFTAKRDDDTHEDGEDTKRHREIFAYLKKHFRYPISLNDMAEYLSLSPEYFSRYFKKLFGANFHTYLRRLRLENALKDLAVTDKPVTATAYDNGFPNLTAFTKVVREETGQAPTDYRKSHRIKEQEEDPGAEEASRRIDPFLVKEKLVRFIDEKTGPMTARKNISVQAGSGVSFERPWREVINLGFATDFEKSDFMSQIVLLQKETPFRYGRFQGLFGNSMISISEEAEYHFARIDKLIDFLYSVGLLPFIELGFKPSKVNKTRGTLVFNNNDGIKKISIEEYEKLIVHFLKHAISRYGIQEVKLWRFEYWLPADDKTIYLGENIGVYIEQFARIRRTIKEIVPSLLFGGPGFCPVRQQDIYVLGRIIKGLAAAKALPDFLSFYFYAYRGRSAEAEEKDGFLTIGAKNEILERITRIKGDIEKINRTGNLNHRNDLSGILFFATEWNIDFSCRSLIHDNLLKAPFIIQNSIDVIGNIDVLSYWLASDISAEYTDSDAPLFGGAGLISRYGIRKPAFFAFRFLSQLGEKLLEKGDGYIITSKSEHEFAAIIFNYKYIGSRLSPVKQFWDITGNISEYLEDQENCSFSLEIHNIIAGRYELRQHILNSGHGSVYDAWLGLSAINNPRPNETAWLKQTCVPDLKISFLEAKESIKIDCELEPNEVRLLEISLTFE